MKNILWVLAMFFAFTSMVLAAVNLNTATKDELDAVKGIGPAKAQAIIDYRTKNGPFKSVDDLKNVNGFGDKTVAKMRSELSVSGASTMKKEDKPGKADNKMTKADKKAETKAGKEPKEVAVKEEKKADKKEAKADNNEPKADKKAAKEAKVEAAKDGAKTDKKADKKAAAEAKKADKEAKKAKKKADKEAKPADKK